MKHKLVVFLLIAILLCTSCTRISNHVFENQKMEIEKPKIEGETFEEKIEQAEKKEPQKESSADGNLLSEKDSAQVREINLFLSNFSETFYDPDSEFFGEEEGKIYFAYLHALINSESLIFGKDEYFGIKAEDVDRILIRFFGSSVPHETPKNSRYWIYEDGAFFMPAASGESYGDFSIATEMTQRKDGNFDVSFNIYHDPTVFGGDVISDQSVYSLSASEAEKKHDYIGSGKAVLKEKTYNGENTYELVSYEVNYEW